MSATELLDAFHDKQRRVFAAMIEIYGDDTDAVLNALHAVSARLAIVTGVSPEKFSAGIKHHWDFLAEAVNSQR